MPTWRCANCGTLQEESARCWVCHRSTTSCGTCRHFRGAVAGSLGYCGLDPRRRPLVGSEVRGCWQEPMEPALPEEAARRAAAGSASPATDPPIRAGRPRLEFVPVGETVADRPIDRLELAPSAPPVTAPRDPAFGFWSDVEA